jgi:hypothetical protein
MKRARFIGGLLLMGAAAVTFLGPWDVPLPASIALLIVGMALVAVSRRMR